MRIPAAKILLRNAYKAYVGLHALANLPSFGRASEPRVFYGGARVGDTGGTLVKVKRLRQYFPEYRWSYNLVYGLSNAPYLPACALRLLNARGIPIVCNQNGVFYPAWFAGDWQARNVEMSHAYHLADHVFWQSEFCRRAADEFLGERVGPGEILYNAVDTGHYAPPGRHDDESPRPFRFLLTGVIGSHLYYRIESTLEGLAGARKAGLDCELEVAGPVSPEAITQAKALAERLHILDHVYFTGPYTQGHAPEIYGRAHAYVMMKHNDPCPNTVIEALACGLPVVYSDTGGVGELVGSCGVGVACEESWEKPKVPESDAISDGMLYAAKHHAELSSKARERAVEHFDIAHWIGRHADVFEKLIAERS